MRSHKKKLTLTNVKTNVKMSMLLLTNLVKEKLKNEWIPKVQMRMEMEMSSNKSTRLEAGEEKWALAALEKYLDFYSHNIGDVYKTFSAELYETDKRNFSVYDLNSVIDYGGIRVREPHKKKAASYLIFTGYELDDNAQNSRMLLKFTISSRGSRERQINIVIPLNTFLSMNTIKFKGLKIGNVDASKTPFIVDVHDLFLRFLSKIST